MRVALPTIFVVLAAATSIAAPASAALIPHGRTPVAKLAPRGVEHEQILQIRQDFHPNDKYDIALDAWIDKSSPDAIAQVRMWWLDTGAQNERSPFGKGVRRHIAINYDQHDSGDWAVRIRQGRKEFRFDIELDDNGGIAAFANIDTKRGSVDHCRVEDSRLVATKVLGIPAGLKRLDVTCTDAEGNRHRGHIRHRRVRR